MRHFTRDERVIANQAIQDYYKNIEELYEAMIYDLEEALNLDPESIARLIREEGYKD